MGQALTTNGVRPAMKDAPDMFDLRGRVAFVTGAGQGVGAAIAVLLAQRGAKVGVNDISADRAEATVSTIAGMSGTAMAAPADITDRSQLSIAILSIVKAYGPIDILVNNAGVPPDGFTMGPFVDTERMEWDRYIDLNLYGAMTNTHLVLESMQERGFGRIISIVSDSGRFGEPKMAAYSASKAGVMGFTRSLAMETGRYGITCNNLSLGSIEPAAHLQSERDEQRARLYPMRRLGRPDDVAAAVIWLASDEAGWVTGQTISINGGYVGS